MSLASLDNNQIVNLGLTRSDLERYLLESGLWSRLPSEGSENTHYRLSPCAYRLTRYQQMFLHMMAVRTFAALEKVNNRLCALSEKFPLDNNEARFFKLARTASRGLLLPRPRLGLPPVIKVDLVCHKDNTYRIAEVDVYNPRGFGYLALLEGTLPSGVASRFPSIERLASLLKAAQKAPEAEWSIIVSDFERYYGRAFSVLVSALGRYGVRARVVRESQLNLGSPLLEEMAHALIIPESLGYTALRDRLLEKYQEGTLTLLYPPAAYLGSKAFLPALIRERMGRYIPKCRLVSRHEDPLPLMGPDVVLKGVVSSGMKQVVFSDLEPARFLHTLREARRQRFPKWIMQEQVPQKPIPISFFNDRGEEEVGKFYSRLTVYITPDGVLAAEVTAREVKEVHGASDCLMIPCILA